MKKTVNMKVGLKSVGAIFISALFMGLLAPESQAAKLSSLKKEANATIAAVLEALKAGREKGFHQSLSSRGQKLHGSSSQFKRLRGEYLAQKHVLAGDAEITSEILAVPDANEKEDRFLQYFAIELLAKNPQHGAYHYSHFKNVSLLCEYPNNRPREGLIDIILDDRGLKPTQCWISSIE